MQYVFLLPSFCFLVGCGDDSKQSALENSTLDQVTAAAAGNVSAEPITKPSDAATAQQ